MNALFLGSFLQEQGLVTQAQVEEAAAFQADANRRLGDLAVEAGLLTPEQVETVLAMQRVTDLSFGALAVASGFVARRDMDALVFRQHVNQVHLGEALLMLGYLTPEQFAVSLDRYAALERQRQAGLDRLLQGHCGRVSLPGFVAKLERAFLRFAHCPLKAQGGLSESSLASLGNTFSASLAMGDSAVLHYTLFLGEDMLAILRAAAAARDTAPPDPQDPIEGLLAVIGRYLHGCLDQNPDAKITCERDPSMASGFPEDCLRLSLACPGTFIGLSVRVRPAPATARG